MKTDRAPGSVVSPASAVQGGYCMKSYDAKNIRNIAIAGHTGKGKTTLAEAMLFLAKATDRLGKVSDGNTVMDFDP